MIQVEGNSYLKDTSFSARRIGVLPHPIAFVYDNKQAYFIEVHEFKLNLLAFR